MISDAESHAYVNFLKLVCVGLAVVFSSLKVLSEVVACDLKNYRILQWVFFECYIARWLKFPRFYLLTTNRQKVEQRHRFFYSS